MRLVFERGGILHYNSYIPCRYSRFVFLSGVGIAFGLYLTTLFLMIAAPSTPDTSAQIGYINTAESCIETAFAVLVGSLAAAAIGEAVFKHHPT